MDTRKNSMSMRESLAGADFRKGTANKSWGRDVSVLCIKTVYDDIFNTMPALVSLIASPSVLSFASRMIRSALNFTVFIWIIYIQDRIEQVFPDSVENTKERRRTPTG